MREQQVRRLFLAVGLTLGGGAHAGDAWGAPAKQAAPKFLVVVRSVDEAPGVKSELLDQARALFAADLARHPEVTLTAPPELGADAAAVLQGEPAAYKDVLIKHHLKAIELTMRILEVGGSTEPPPPGKTLRVLKRSIKLSVFGTTLPEKVMAVGGDGDAAIASEIRRTEDEGAEGKKLLAEAAKIAITQAVDMTVVKLLLPPPKDQGGKHARKKK